MNDNEYTLLEEISKALKPVYIGVNSLCKENVNVIDGDKIVAFISNKLAAMNSPFARTLHDKFKTRINNRRSVGIASLLTHLTKQEKLPNFDYHSLDEIADLGIKLFERLKFEIDENESIIEVDNDEPLEGDTRENDLNMQGELDAMLNKKPLQKSESLQGAIISANNDDVRIQVLIETLKSMNVTSVNPERAFSIAGWINAPRRSRMGAKLLDAIVFLKYNLVNFTKCK